MRTRRTATRDGRISAWLHAGAGDSEVVGFGAVEDRWRTLFSIFSRFCRKIINLHREQNELLQSISEIYKLTYWPGKDVLLSTKTLVDHGIV